MARVSRAGGFSLVETAIVLAVLGAVLGGLWAISAQAWEYVRCERTVEAVNTTVTNIRSYFGGQAGLPDLGVENMSAQLINLGVIPSNLTRSSGQGCAVTPCADTPWGPYAGGVINPWGTFRVCNWKLGMGACFINSGGVGATSPFFAVVLGGVTKKSCISLVEAISGPKGPDGLVEMNVGSTNLTAVHPVSDADATTACTLLSNGNPQTDGTISVRFAYRFIASSF